MGVGPARPLLRASGFAGAALLGVGALLPLADLAVLGPASLGDLCPATLPLVLGAAAVAAVLTGWRRLAWLPLPALTAGYLVVRCFLTLNPVVSHARDVMTGSGRGLPPALEAVLEGNLQPGLGAGAVALGSLLLILAGILSTGHGPARSGATR